MRTVYTVGYEGRSIAEFLKVLADAGVTRVIDVRELPLSRKKGFSKTKLRESLDSHGIDYVHLRDAGNPYRSMRHDIKQCLSLYKKHIDSRPDVLTQVREHIEGHRVALLCVESQPEHCHRSILAAHLGSRIRDL